MIKKKRYFLLGKKGQEAEHEVIQTVIEAIMLAVFVYILFTFVSDIRGNTIFEKNYFARDLAMMVNTVYASPQDLVYVYPDNTSRFYITIKDNKVRIHESALEAEEIDKIYWYADENQTRLDIEESFDNIDNLEFIKTMVNGITTINAIGTVLEIQPTQQLCTPDGAICDNNDECCSGTCIESHTTGISHCGLAI